MSEHSSVVGGSTAGRIIACPPSRLGVRPDVEEESEFARIGTLLHEVMEKLCARQYIAMTDELEPHWWKVEEMERAWLAYMESEFVEEVHIEMRVHFPQVPGAFGTVDLLMTHGDDRVTIWDWKTGEGIQVYPDSKQLMFYAAAAMYDPGTKHLFGPDTRVTLAICQPNNRGLDTVRLHDVTTMDLFNFTQDLVWAIANGHDDSLLKSGDHCQWCPIKAVCPQLREEAKRAVDWADPHVETSPAEIAQMLDMIPTLELWVKAVKDYAHSAVEHGKQIPGYKLVARQARTNWTDVEKAKAFLSEILGAKEYYNAIDVKPKSVAAVNKLLDAKGMELPKELYNKKSSGTVVVPESDRRAEIPSAQMLEGLAEQIKAESRRRN